MRIIFAILFMFVSAPAMACFPEDHLPCGALSDEDMFVGFDDNKNGLVSYQEYMAHNLDKNKEAAFVCADKDKNKKLSLEEFKESFMCAQNLQDDKTIDDIIRSTVDEQNKKSKTKIKIIPFEEWNKQTGRPNK